MEIIATAVLLLLVLGGTSAADRNSGGIRTGTTTTPRTRKLQFEPLLNNTCITETDALYMANPSLEDATVSVYTELGSTFSEDSCSLAGQSLSCNLDFSTLASYATLETECGAGALAKDLYL